MASGREKLSAVRATGVAALLAAALSLTACTSDSRDNLPRPPIPAGVSVNVTADELVLSPSRVAFGPQVRQQIIENREVDEIQGDPDQPMPVSFTVSNTTRQDIRLMVIGPARRVSRVITPTGTGALSTELPAGAYRIRAVGLPEAGETRLVVGPTRISPQNDLLLP